MHEFDVLVQNDGDGDAASEGDLVLVRRLPRPAQRNVDYGLGKVVQRMGDVVDPCTGESVVGER